LRSPEPLHPDHRIDVFDFGKPTLDARLVHCACQAQGSRSAKTLIVCVGEHVVG